MSDVLLKCPQARHYTPARRQKTVENLELVIFRAVLKNEPGNFLFVSKKIFKKSILFIHWVRPTWMGNH